MQAGVPLPSEGCGMARKGIVCSGRARAVRALLARTEGVFALGVSAVVPRQSDPLELS